MNGSTFVPLEFGYIGKPLFVWLVRMELAVQDVLRNILGVLSPPGAALVGVLDGRLDIPGPADAQHALVIDMDAMVVAKFIIESPITLVRALLMDLLDLVGQTLILLGPAAQLPASPFVVGGAGHMELFAGCFDRIPLFLMALLNGYINLTLPYFR